MVVFRPAELVLHATVTVMLAVKLVFFEVYKLSNQAGKDDDNHASIVSLIIVLL